MESRRISENTLKEVCMDSKELKKILAGLSIAGLLAGVNIPAAGFAAEGKSGWGGSKSGAGSTHEEVAAPHADAEDGEDTDTEDSQEGEEEETAPKPAEAAPGGWGGRK